MNREDVLKMTTEELCAVLTPKQVNEVVLIMSQRIEDTEMINHLDSRLGHLAAPYVEEINAGFAAGRRDVSETIARLHEEPPLVRLRVWSHVTHRGTDDIERAKYAHKHMVKTILSVFGMEIPPGKEPSVVNAVPSVFNKPK